MMDRWLELLTQSTWNEKTSIPDKVIPRDRWKGETNMHKYERNSRGNNETIIPLFVRTEEERVSSSRNGSIAHNESSLIDFSVLNSFWGTS